MACNVNFSLQFMDDDAGAFAHRLRPRQPTKAQLEQAKARKKKELQARRELSKQKITARRRETYIASLERAPEVFNPKVPVGTGFHELRRARVAYDLMTGAPGNPDGPWKAYTAEIRTPDRYHVPLALDAFHETGEGFWYSAGIQWVSPPSSETDLPCVAPLVTQFTGQCYLAAVLNMLIATPEIKQLMELVFARMPPGLLDIVRHASTIPADVPMPLGLSLLQLFYKQYANAAFTPTPVVAVLERRLRGASIDKGGGGFELPTCIMVLSSLGIPWVLSSDVSPLYTMGDKNTSSALVELVHITNLSVVQPWVKQQRRCAGALVGIDGHAYAALDCDILFDSHMLARKLQWRQHPLQDATMQAEEPVQDGNFMYVAAALASETTADAVIRACVGTHDYYELVKTLLFSWDFSKIFTYADMGFNRTTGVLHGDHVYKINNDEDVYVTFADGKLQSRGDGPVVVKVKNSPVSGKSITFVWVVPTFDRPLVDLELEESPGTIYANHDLEIEADIAAGWLPSAESLPPGVLDISWVRATMGTVAAAGMMYLENPSDERPPYTRFKDRTADATPTTKPTRKPECAIL